tara:strand:- start:824 stop:1075 length:252 start_codon:yes stop_codon:yes gene_type:complete
MENKEVCIKKIPLDNFINILMELYNKGLDYVDIQGVTDDDQDRLAISFTNEYMTPEGIDNFMGSSHMEKMDMKLTDEDLNRLL